MMSSSTACMRISILLQPRPLFSCSPKRQAVLIRNSPFSRFSPTINHGPIRASRSSHSTSFSKSLPSDAKSLHPSPSDRLNPPASTRPAPLEIAERQPNESLAHYVYASGKKYLAFYKIGLKNIMANWRAARALRNNLKQLVKTSRESTQNQSTLQTNGDAPTTSHNTLLVSLTPTRSIAIDRLSRAELQLLRRSAFDARRIPIFGVLFLIFGEWLPLFVIFFTSMVPYTCRIPKQIRKSRQAMEDRRRKVFRGELAEVVDPRSVQATGENIASTVASLNRNQLLPISRSLGLHGSFWDRLAPSGVDSGLRIPPTSVLTYKVRKHLDYLQKDDYLMRKDGKIANLVEEEVRIACEERGIDVLGRDVVELRKVLQSWSDASQQGRMVQLLLSRPNAWKEILRSRR